MAKPFYNVVKIYALLYGKDIRSSSKEGLLEWIQKYISSSYTFGFDPLIQLQSLTPGCEWQLFEPDKEEDLANIIAYADYTFAATTNGGWAFMDPIVTIVKPGKDKPLGVYCVEKGHEMYSEEAEAMNMDTRLKGLFL